MENKHPEPNSESSSTSLLGTVLAVQANYYQVGVDASSPLPLEAAEREGAKGAEAQRRRGAEAQRSGGETPLSTEDSQPTQDSGHRYAQASYRTQDSQPTQDSGHRYAQASYRTQDYLLCTRRARLKKIGQQVMVGDRVVIAEPDWAGGRGAIADVLPRQSQLDRPPIANVKQILLVFAMVDPPLDTYQMSRFLVKAESTGLDVALCLNKSDLVTLEEQKQWRDRLQQWGYEPILISVHTGMGLEELRERLKNNITVLAGPSGVGKSSIINYLIPDVNLRTGEVSGKLSRGRHTTRHVELFKLPDGGLLADTPGFNQPDLECSPEELAGYFPEARQGLESARCRFSDCLHGDEPDCAVRGDWERYEHYLDFLETAIARQEQLNQQANPESTLKVKTKRQGQSEYEPKLETKKYRRLSRRTQQQRLQELYEEAELEDE